MSSIQNRIEAVRAHLDEWNVDALLISSATNRKWLTGFPGSLGYVAISAEKAILATDGRYWTMVEEECPDVTLYKYRRGPNALSEFLTSLQVRRVGIESQHVNVDEYTQMQSINEMMWVPLDDTVETLRFVKSADEIATIRAAAAIADIAMSQVNAIAKVGMSEKALAWELEKLMRENGADALAFDTIVASGPHGARPHHHPSDRPLQEGDAITIDLGALLNGYHSDMTRTFHMGNTPSDKFWEVYNLVLKAEETAIAGLKAGVISADIDAIARDIITEGGHGEAFMHSLGHGVGLEIHEGPSVSYMNTKGTLPANSVVTIEPGIYLPGWSGSRIEDLVLVTEDGSECLSQCPKTPIIPI